MYLGRVIEIFKASITIYKTVSQYHRVISQDPIVVTLRRSISTDEPVGLRVLKSVPGSRNDSLIAVSRFQVNLLTNLQCLRVCPEWWCEGWSGHGVRLTTGEHHGWLSRYGMGSSMTIWCHLDPRYDVQRRSSAHVGLNKYVLRAGNVLGTLISPPEERMGGVYTCYDHSLILFAT